MNAISDILKFMMLGYTGGPDCGARLLMMNESQRKK